MRNRTIVSMIGFLLCAPLAACSRDQDQPAPAQESARIQTEAGAPPAGYQTAPVPQGGTIGGQVLFKGRHVPATLAVGKDHDVCGKAIQDPRLIVGAGGAVKNAVVRITDIGQGKPAPVKEAVMDQRKCEFVPHVLAIVAGTAVKVTNSDGILHNIHTLSKDNPAFNRAQPKYLKEITETFSKPEIIPVRCDVHGWMGGWIYVAANPYFEVTAADGSFKITDVPAGRYTVEVWHETLGKLTRQVRLDPGQTIDANFEFAAKP